MKAKILSGVVAVAIAAIAAVNVNFNSEAENTLSALNMANVEALAQNESGAKCPNGCRDIGFGTHEILQCDCEYTSYFSSCDSWGC